MTRTSCFPSIDKEGFVMLEFERKTERFINEHKLITDGDSIVAAVSGGPDSIAMLDFLVNRRERYGIKLAVAHVDHMLREEESLLDLEYVKSYCIKQNIIFKSASIDINRKMKNDKTGLQETARKYRYRFFEKVMQELHANKLVVGQHSDDQMETILMRLTRGSRGIARAGIQVRRTFGSGELIRPLLGVQRSEIEKYCSLKELDPRRDRSNEKPTYTRNRFRMDILPILKRENNNAHEQFQRFSEDITEDEIYLQSLAKEHFEEMCRGFVNDEITLNISAFQLVPLPLQRRVIHLILNYLYKQKASDLTALHIDLIQQLLKSGNPSGQLDLPNGLRAIRSYEQCRFTFAKEKQSQDYYYELEENSRLQFPNGMIVEIEKDYGYTMKSKENIVILDPDDVQLPLIVRTRRPGDRINIKGMKGSKKVKNIFIEMKIPLEDRAGWPIIADNTGKILWIPGLRKSSYDTVPTEEQMYYSIYCDSKQTNPRGQQNQ